MNTGMIALPRSISHTTQVTANFLFSLLANLFSLPSLTHGYEKQQKGSFKSLVFFLVFFLIMCFDLPQISPNQTREVQSGIKYISSPYTNSNHAIHH
jgi:hypothetical protein